MTTTTTRAAGSCGITEAELAAREREAAAAICSAYLVISRCAARAAAGRATAGAAR